MPTSQAFADFPPRAIARRLLAWYDRHRRPLPWRDEVSIYHTWVSEIMLQQTQVSTVIPYFQKFISHFPDIASLARAPLSKVLRCWEGLGYYRRARNLHRAARRIMRDHKGQFPTVAEQVQELPGIGRYTAGAILSIALNQRLPILEGNTQRLLSRLLALRDEVDRAAGRDRLWSFAEHLLPAARVGDFNQALMELGSVCCTLRDPQCPICPLRQWCRAHQLGAPDRFPKVRRRQPSEKRREVAVVVLHRGRLLLRRCRDDERWSELWDVPRYVRPARRALRALEDQLFTDYHLTVELVAGSFRTAHAVTRFRIDLTTAVATACRGRLPPSSGARWTPLSALAEIPLNITARRLINHLGLLAGGETPVGNGVGPSRRRD